MSLLKVRIYKANALILSPYVPEKNARDECTSRGWRPQVTEVLQKTGGVEPNQPMKTPRYPVSGETLHGFPHRNFQPFFIDSFMTLNIFLFHSK